MDTTRKCRVCLRNVQTNGTHLKCKNCSHLNHIKCVGMSRDEAQIIRDWYCPKCVQSVLPFNHFNEEDEFAKAVKEIPLNCTFRQHLMDDINFDPFTLNESINNQLYDTDPDIQYYLDTQYIGNTNCDYFIEDTFNDKVKNVPTDDEQTLSFLHLNVRSLPKHNDALLDYLNLLKHTFKFIGLTETWLKEYICDLYSIDGYNCHHKYRSDRKG